mmetsp:Transcript_16894/g.39301  ORF Transcript_16894/g.39301 Transcript_16894/m.39301 type:complete len:595 (-) Transcript_16894:202-1986(-)
MALTKRLCGRVPGRRSCSLSHLGRRSLLFVALTFVASKTIHDRSFVSAPGSRPQGVWLHKLSARAAETSVQEETETKTRLSSDATALARERLETAKTVSETEFWSLVREKQVREAVIVSWNRKQLLAHLEDGSYVGVTEESDPEDVRNELLLRGVPFSYPASDILSEEEALQEAKIGSEAPVAGGVLTAVAVALADVALEISAPAALGGAGIGLQSFIEGETPAQVIVDDLELVEGGVEKVALGVEAGAEAAASGAFGWSASAISWCQAAWVGLFANHAPGIGGIIEDAFMSLLVLTSLFSLFQMASLKRKAASWAGDAHTATGAMQIAIVLYAIVEERCLREAPGTVWAVFTWIIFMVNNLTMWPLLKYFKGPEVQRVLFKLAYSFIISFQGIHAIAWSITYPWLYWVVMPFWFYSVKKLAESSDNVLALLPDQPGLTGFQEGARRRVKGIVNDTPTIVYSVLNFGGAVFDNLYMAVYTWRGPDGFWGWSAANIEPVNDHLRTALVKPAFGSLTISVLVFLGTLVYRRKISKEVAIGANVILASIGPWLILYYHKLVDFSEPWQPEIDGDWGSVPYFINHMSDLTDLMKGGKL